MIVMVPAPPFFSEAEDFRYMDRNAGTVKCFVIVMGPSET